MKDIYSGHIYIIERADRYIKIGKSQNPDERIRAIETQSGIPALKVWVSPCCINYSKMERECHKMFREFRKIGEYFSVDFGVAQKFAESLEFEHTENNEKKPRSSTVIATRVTKEEYHLVEQAAREEGKTLSSWLIDAIKDPRNYDEGETYPFSQVTADSYVSWA